MHLRPAAGSRSAMSRTLGRHLLRGENLARMALSNFHHRLAEMDVDTVEVLYIQITERSFYLIRYDGVYQTPSNIRFLASRNAHRPVHTEIGWFHAISHLVMYLLERIEMGNWMTVTVRRSAAGVLTWNINISNDDTASPLV
ncbi:hypothetical protein QFC22_006343 [Naganishia vaughanmartiniae]|uniref:Uncharacterized protein n=1 Tax=Naganishia vaughanmartiniae TaxID=1424756 RepID=A0ACC2WM71_9TREE|nr:hypothetical protein QFC22_006343 [Naganishia vaughanmartiniae]